MKIKSYGFWNYLNKKEIKLPNARNYKKPHQLMGETEK